MTGSMPRAALLTLTLAVAPAAWSAESGKAPEQLGKVSFANSCVPAVQERFERGVALLHSFWFTEGAVAFREVLEADPNCAIATWGLASILIGNPFAAGPTPQRAAEAQAAIDRGRKIAGGTERERAYVEAVAASTTIFPTGRMARAESRSRTPSRRSRNASPTMRRRSSRASI